MSRTVRERAVLGRRPEADKRRTKVVRRGKPRALNDEMRSYPDSPDLINLLNGVMSYEYC
jgi:hypothetical protein